ncbi:MAG TPA: divergent polysaccharide deacetylase family protein [Candidatus Acidoferrales bacterium]
MNRRPDGLGIVSTKKIPQRPILFFLLAAALFFAAGCKKKPAPLSNVAIRNISREFVFAARNASGGHADVGMRPEYAGRQTGKQPALTADQIYITVPRGKGGLPDQATHDAIEAELARVADFHHLERVARPGAPGLERFDYLLQGRRTQSIHLIMPLATEEVPSRTPQRPRLAIVLDDLGSDRTQADTLFRLAYPLTISVLPHEANSGDIAEEAHRRGFQVMLHLPMASNAGDKDEAIELHPGMAAPEVEKIFATMLDTVPYAAGVNNHEGSLGTADQKLMDELMPLLRQHDLFFVDSRTTAATVAETAAHAAGVLTTRRNVFLDDDQSVPAIRKQFELAIRDAREKGSALAIGHPHAATLEVLAEMLPEAAHQGLRLVFASDLAR